MTLEAHIKRTDYIATVNSVTKFIQESTRRMARKVSPSNGYELLTMECYAAKHIWYRVLTDNEPFNEQSLERSCALINERFAAFVKANLGNVSARLRFLRRR